MTSMTPSRVTIVEVGPRDGLQNDPRRFSVEARVAFIEAIAAAGAPVIETGAFVSLRAVPQMASSDAVMRQLDRRDGVRYVALVPNEQGYDRARKAGVDAIALFASATEAFSQANLRASIDESFARFVPVAQRAKMDGVWVRGYVSVAFHCPYAGRTDPRDAIAVAERLLDLGCDEVSIADTIGHATPEEVDRLLALTTGRIPRDRLALHFHDTSGQALANVDAALRHGIAIFDAAAGGLGGCPFAPGAPGNLGTERLVTHLEEQGIATGVDAGAVAEAIANLERQAVVQHGDA